MNPLLHMDSPLVGARRTDATFVPAGRHALRYRPLLLALDDSREAAAAARVATEVAEVRGARPVVVRAVRLTPAVAPFAMGGGFGAFAPLDDDARREHLLAVRRDLRAALGDHASVASDWPTHVDHGVPAAAIADRARQVGAAITVMGLRPHRGIAGLFQDATVMGLAREASVPVLAVTASTLRMPRTILVGVDFGRAGLMAARWALPLLADGGTLILAYVAPIDTGARTEAGEGERVIRAQGIAAAFARLRAEVGTPRDVTLESAMLDGQPAAELLAFAERADADCIAVGSRRHGSVERWLLGSVTADLVHAGTRSVLIVPPHRP